MGFLDKFIKKGKYDVNPEENIPRFVYGVPNLSKYDETNKDIKRCKKCGCILKKYIYGKIKGNIDNSKYILGGCMISDDNPKYYCTNCKIDFDSELKPMSESIESAIN